MRTENGLPVRGMRGVKSGAAADDGPDLVEQLRLRGQRSR